MKVKVLQPFSDKYNLARKFKPGEVVDFEEKRAENIVARGLGEFAEEPEKVKTPADSPVGAIPHDVVNEGLKSGEPVAEEQGEAVKETAEIPAPAAEVSDETLNSPNGDAEVVEETLTVHEDVVEPVAADELSEGDKTTAAAEVNPAEEPEKKKPGRKPKKKED